jgi:hypothetical protein
MHPYIVQEIVDERVRHLHAAATASHRVHSRRRLLRLRRSVRLAHRANRPLRTATRTRAA